MQNRLVPGHLLSPRYEQGFAIIRELAVHPSLHLCREEVLNPSDIRKMKEFCKTDVAFLIIGGLFTSGKNLVNTCRAVRRSVTEFNQIRDGLPGIAP
ncbi:MAG: hypothetical protein JXB88_02125 [Spirochaetales bacterium]|nr:hypothetical protein [Spirochaetales bacterium]